MTKPDLSMFAAAVRLRDRAVAAAVAHHERAGLEPRYDYARATYDAIAADLIAEGRRRAAEAIREFADERAQSAAEHPPESAEAVRRNDAVLGAYHRAAEIADLLEADGNLTDVCGRCVLTPTFTDWTRATQITCPQHGTAAGQPSAPHHEGDHP